MELTEEQSMAMDYIGSMQNKVTAEGKADLWKQNVLANRPFFTKGNPDLKGMTAFIVAAGPSLDKNVHHLADMSGRGIIICVDAALRFLAKNKITPEYCMMIDGSPKMLEMMDGVDTKNITLVATAAACPDVVKKWEGPIFFVTTPFAGVERKFNLMPLTRVVKAKHDIKEGDELMLNEEYGVEFEGVKETIMCGGNVSTATHHFAMALLKVHQVVFVGLDLSWIHESHHYAGHDHQENVRDRTKMGASTHKVPGGKEVFTNLSLLSFKRWHEQFAKQYPGHTINATEGGILGIDQDGAEMKEIKFMPLEEAIAEYAPK